MRRAFVIFYLKNHENGNAVGAFFIKMKHFYKEQYKDKKKPWSTGSRAF